MFRNFTKPRNLAALIDRAPPGAEIVIDGIACGPDLIQIDNDIVLSAASTDYSIDVVIKIGNGARVGFRNIAFTKCVELLDGDAQFEACNFAQDSGILLKGRSAKAGLVSCSFKGLTRVGLDLEDHASAKVTRCNFDGMRGLGINLERGCTCSIEDSVFEKATAAAVRASGPHCRLFLTSSIFRDLSVEAVSLSATAEGKVTSCSFERCVGSALFAMAANIEAIAC